MHGVTEDGDGLRILRAREGRLEAGEVRPLQHGRPLHGELVRLTPRHDVPGLHDVQVLLPHGAPSIPTPQAARQGPAQVATDTYRRNWDRIFSRRSTLH